MWTFSHAFVTIGINSVHYKTAALSQVWVTYFGEDSLSKCKLYTSCKILYWSCYSFRLAATCMARSQIRIVKLWYWTLCSSTGTSAYKNLVLDILDKFSDIVNHSLSSFVSWPNTEKLHWPFFLTRMVWRLWKETRIPLLYNCWSRRCQVGCCLIHSWSLYMYTCGSHVYWQLNMIRMERSW